MKIQKIIVLFMCILILQITTISAKDRTDKVGHDITKIEIIPDENNALRIECQIYEAEIGEVTFQFNNKSGKEEKVILNANPDRDGEYFAVIPSSKLPDRTPFEGKLFVKDKKGNLSTASLSLEFSPELILSTGNNGMTLQGDLLQSQLRMDGKYIIGNLKTNISSIKGDFENLNNLEGKNWIKKIELKNTSNNKKMIPNLSDTGNWDADLSNFLKQGDNRIQYICTNFFNEVTTKDFPVITYNVAPGKIYKVSVLQEGVFLVEMEEKVKLVINKTTFEIDLIKSDGIKTTYQAYGKVTNNDTNIELTTSSDFQNNAKINENDKIVVKIFNISDMQDNITDSIVSDTFIYKN